MSIGLGVMIQRLTEQQHTAFAEAVGKMIANVALVEDELIFTFKDGYKIGIRDDGQSCCEHRYMTCDDDLSYFVGAYLCDAEVRDGPKDDESGEPHEQQFLIVTTNKGDFTVANHNEHNGYYGGLRSVCEDTMKDSRSRSW